MKCRKVQYESWVSVLLSPSHRAPPIPGSLSGISFCQVALHCEHTWIKCNASAALWLIALILRSYFYSFFFHCAFKRQSFLFLCPLSYYTTWLIRIKESMQRAWVSDSSNFALCYRLCIICFLHYWNRALNPKLLVVSLLQNLLTCQLNCLIPAHIKASRWKICQIPFFPFFLIFWSSSFSWAQNHNCRHSQLSDHNRFLRTVMWEKGKTWLLWSPARVNNLSNPLSLAINYFLCSH